MAEARPNLSPSINKKFLLCILGEAKKNVKTITLHPQHLLPNPCCFKPLKHILEPFYLASMPLLLLVIESVQSLDQNTLRTNSLIWTRKIFLQIFRLVVYVFNRGIFSPFCKNFPGLTWANPFETVPVKLVICSKTRFQ
jgi:hypothetical protein